MASDPGNSDSILNAARTSLRLQQAGGRRLAPRGAQQLRRGHLGLKARNILLGVLGLWLALSLIGTVVNGIGLSGLMLGGLATLVLVGLLGKYPSMRMPGIEDLNPAQANAQALVAKTELWLEGQRRSLPPPAVKLVDHIGLQLDVLGAQMADVDPTHPKAAEVRKLVGEHLPGLVEGYRRIPEHLRFEETAGETPTSQFLTGLQTISGEIDSVTRQLAAGAIDDLAIKTRYLDYRYGESGDDGGGPN